MSDQEIKTTWDQVLGRLTPSTIRGIVVVCGTLGWNFTEGKVQAWIAVITLLVYGAYDILRTDSAKKAIDVVQEQLTKRGVIAIFLLIGCALILPMNAHADSALCVEPQITAGTYTLEVDGGAPIVGLPFVLETEDGEEWHCIYDVGTLGAGNHTFRTMAVDASGWEGIWSDPFVATRPSASQRHRIIQR